jgi:hypothetical protein
MCERLFCSWCTDKGCPDCRHTGLAYVQEWTNAPKPTIVCCDSADRACEDCAECAHLGAHEEECECAPDFCYRGGPGVHAT